MSFNSTLEYRTFNQLIADAAGDFKKYQMADLIDPQDYIKIARKVNYDLGLRIHKVKEVVLEIEKGRAQLPNDFYTLEFALGLGEHTTRQYLPQGTHVEDKVVGQLIPEYQQAPPENIDFCTDVVPVECDPCDPCGDCYDPCAPCPQCNTAMVDGICTPCCTNPDSCTLQCNGDVTQLVQRVTSGTRYYKHIFPLRITSNTEDVNGVCPNLYWDSPMTAVIRDGWLQTSFQTGKVYLNYQGHLEDEEGNLMVPDHPILNEYYEYAIKKRMLENLIMDDQEVNINKINLINGEYRIARNNANSLVNTPNFQELKELFKAHRNASYSKYYDMFAQYPRRR